MKRRASYYKTQGQAKKPRYNNYTQPAAQQQPIIIYKAPRTQHGETKYFDTSIPLTAIQNVQANDWTGTEIDPTPAGTIFSPAVGSAYNQREGKKVFIKKIKIKGQVVCPTGAVALIPDSTRVRVILYMDKQSNGAQAQGEDVIAGPGTNDVLDMFQNVANFGRFQVLSDKMVTMDAPNFTFVTNYQRGGQVRKFKMNHTFKEPMPVNYNTGNNGNISDVVDNSFHLIAGVSTVIAANPPTIYYRARIVYCE